MNKLLPLLLFFTLLLTSIAHAQSIPQAAYCNIEYMDVANDMTLGTSDGAIMFRITQTRTELDNNTQYNYTLMHASCYMNIIEQLSPDDYDIISTEPYNNIIPHGLRYTTAGGALNFLLDMNRPFWKPDTNYTWQVYCYCLDYNLTKGPQDEHVCWYGAVPFVGMGNWSGFPVQNTLACVDTGTFVTGKDYRRAQTYSGGLAVMLFVLLITGLVFFYPLLKDYLRQPLSNNEYLNLTYRRLCYILATYLMILNSAIMAQVSVKSGLLLHNEMFLYLRLFGIAAQILIYYMIFKTILDLLNIWKENKKEKRGHE